MMNIIGEEPKHMKYLKIENSKGFYLKSWENENSWVDIDKITKEDLLKLLEIAVSSDFEIEGYNDKLIAHKAHQIIYKSISEKFSDLIENKTQFIDECDSVYKEAITKYSSEG